MLALNLLKQLCGRLCYSLTMEWSRLFAHLFVNSIKYIICGRSKVGLRLGDTTLVIPSHVSYLNCLTSSVSALVHLFTCLCVVLEETGCCVQTLKSLITCYRPPFLLKKQLSSIAGLDSCTRWRCSSPPKLEARGKPRARVTNIHLCVCHFVNEDRKDKLASRGHCTTVHWFFSWMIPMGRGPWRADEKTSSCVLRQLLARLSLRHHPQASLTFSRSAPWVLSQSKICQ